MTRVTVGWPRRVVRLVATIIIVGVSLTLLHRSTQPTYSDTANAGPDWPAACLTDNPWLVATAFPVRFQEPRDDPAVVMFRDTSEGDSHTEGVLVEVAPARTLGAVYGLAVDATRGHIYSAAYMTAYKSFSAGGPGAIYRTDLSAGTTALFGTSHAGPDPHAQWQQPDYREAVTRVAYGDIELDSGASVLSAVNLFDQRIHQWSVPDGHYLGSWATPAHDASDDVVTFGLDFADGWLYLLAYAVDTHDVLLYRTRLDGASHELVFSFSYLDFAPTWQPWVPRESSSMQPLPADLAVLDDSEYVIGVRDRNADLGSQFGSGDLLRVGRRNGAVRLYDPDFFEDDIFDRDTTQGQLALLPSGKRIVTEYAAEGTVLRGGLWFDVTSGRVDGPFQGVEGMFSDRSGLGDIETMCVRLRELYLPSLHAR